MFNNFDYNFHTHTIRCNHAVDEDEKYVFHAIKNGIKHLGFSDHIPFVSKRGSQSYYRIPISKANDYNKSISALKEKYKGKIEISLGYEMEYYSDYFKEMFNTAKQNGAEYLILGQHFYESEYDGGKYVLSWDINKNDLINYVNSVIEAMNTGVFTYVAHPDIIDFRGDNDFYISEMTRLIVASKELNVPLEINTLGIRANRTYPNPLFWKLAGEIGSPVVIGSDAHMSKDVYDIDSISQAFEMINKYKLNYVGKPKLIKI